MNTQMIICMVIDVYKRQARALRGQVFYFDRNDATLPAGRWYVADLLGCEVRDADTGKSCV